MKASESRIWATLLKEKIPVYNLPSSVKGSKGPI